ncbi:hypothetical protein F5876DRAFT_70267 [Lentinula aff. lateritia]|uniref:Uncharacterized protein n=1 Tax=Lentinula aff. lateritia TaxID=2804960 RepID=A0ACC1TJT5_9AGAR|nr:hypothetical protein F5876DRAFT_70267 [Lentinula aff. lateritia]
MTTTQVIARLRPLLPGGVCDDGIRIISHPTSTSSLIGSKCEPRGHPPLHPGTRNPHPPRHPTLSLTQQTQHYPFHSAYNPRDTSAAALFEIDMRPLLEDVLGEGTMTIFAYGVTSSGKTWEDVHDAGERGLLGWLWMSCLKVTGTRTRTREAEAGRGIGYLDVIFALIPGESTSTFQEDWDWLPSKSKSSCVPPPVPSDTSGIIPKSATIGMQGSNSNSNSTPTQTPTPTQP